MIDVVIPAHEKDIDTLELCILFIKKNCINIKDVHVVSRKKLTNNAHWIPETRFPFTINDVASRIGVGTKTGWYYQQLLKLYVSKVCNFNNVLVLDSDTMFLRPTEFCIGDKSFFNVSSENGLPYYECMEKLVPGLKKQTEFSGVSHHMILQKDILDSLHETIEGIHKMTCWEAILNCSMGEFKTVPQGATVSNGTGRFSEYELYFNYILKHHSDRVAIRPLKSILAYKGRMGVAGEIIHNVGSRTNLHGNVFVLTNEEEKSISFDCFKDSCEYISKKCEERGWDTVTFQNHTRIGTQQHNEIYKKHIKDALNIK
jgi:hypothetical protein